MGTDGLASLQAQGIEGGRPWTDRLYGTSSALATRLSLVVVGVVGGWVCPSGLGLQVPLSFPSSWKCVQGGL